MGAAENARAGLAVYEDKMDQARREIGTLVEKLERALALISDSGVIGQSQNQDLMSARGFLSMAWQSAKAAGEHAQQSQQPAQAFVGRVFPA